MHDPPRSPSSPARVAGAALYRFDARCHVASTDVGGVPTCTEELSSYRGRVNDDTFAKEVCLLYGEQYVCSGGDCGHVYVWGKRSGELLLKVMPAR